MQNHSCIYYSNLLAQIFRKLNLAKQPWLAWLSGLRAGPKTRGSLVQLPVRAQSWVVGQVPSRGYMRGNHTLLFLSLAFSLPSPCIKMHKYNLLKNLERGWVLTDVAHSVGHCPAKWKLPFNSQPGHGPGCGLVPRRSGRVQEATDQCFSLTPMFLFLSFSLPSPLSK